MALENVKLFYEELGKNDNLFKQLKENKKTYNGDNVATDVIVPFAKKNGFDFTSTELVDFQKSLSVNGELDESSLDLVAGGVSQDARLDLMKKEFEAMLNNK